MMIFPMQNGRLQPLLWPSAVLAKEPPDIHGSQGTSAPGTDTQQTALSVRRVLNKYLLSEHKHEQHCQLSAKGSKIFRKSHRLSVGCCHPDFSSESRKDVGQFTQVL
jgi:N-acetyl-gamma-glutamylphosphate reductase